uniref:C2H2-type domain-containing protein n=1 Tax=Brassica campestris TaxID=3711 RepID=M4E143_BRACM
METTPFVFDYDDDEAKQIVQLSADHMAQGDHIKALEVIVAWISSHKKHEVADFLRFQQGQIFFEQAKRADDSDVKFAFLLGAVECFSENDGFSSFCAASLFGLGNLLGSPLYLKKSIGKAKEYLTIMASFGSLTSEDEKSRKDVENVLKAAESSIAAGSPIQMWEPKVRESKKCTDHPSKIEVEGLRMYWSGLNVEIKRKFMEVSIADFTSYVRRFHGTEGGKALEKVVGSAVSKKKWRFWMCRSCSEEFFTLKKFKIHLEKEHATKFKPSTAEHMAQMVDEVWAGMITVAGWEPVDTAAAAEMIKTRLEFVKLLQEIRLLLLLFCERKILSCGLRDWMMRFLIKHLARFEVSKHTLTTECRLVETPQSICFLARRELEQILDLLKGIKCEREDGREVICRAVDSFYSSTRVKEKIDFDKQFSSLLLDKRLLRCEIAQFDDEGAVSFFNPDDHYAKAHARGDDIVSWLADDSSGDERFRFPRPVRTHNLDIWVAVLRAVQYTCRTLGTKYAKKLQLLGYDAGLVDAINLCVSENTKRLSVVTEHQCSKYASLLGDECERKREARDSHSSRLFLCSVRDALEEAPRPTFDFPDLEDCLKRIHGLKDLSDEVVLESIDRLRSMVADKVALVDTKMLLVENSRINLFNDLIRLSVFDHRFYVLRPLKEFFLKTSTSMSVNLDLQGTSPSLQTTEKDFTEPPDNSLSSERNRLEISSNTVDEEEAAQGMQNMPGEESVHREGAARCNSALDMTLKALLNIKILKEDLMQNEKPLRDDLEKQVPELLHSYLLSDLLTSREVLSTSSDAAEIVVSILESWHSCKSQEIESLVTRLFTLEEYERMSCSRCRQKPNYPEQSSYGIVMAADSIRDLKCAFGNIKFEDILKMIRMEDKMLCDLKTGGCGKANVVHHIISRCPPIFTVVLEWEKHETEKEISETAKALDWEIDMSRLYEGLESSTNYRLVSLVGCGEDKEHICLAYEKDRWIGIRHDAFTEEAVGNWESVIRFCGERKVRPKILLYEAAH